jgi:hypothetical protein
MADTATIDEAVVVPDDLSEIPAHYACRICWPREGEEVYALCGEKLLGIKAPLDAVSCDACEACVIEHIMAHHQGAGA